MEIESYFEKRASEIEKEIFKQIQSENQTQKDELIHKFLNDISYQNKILKLSNLRPMPNIESSAIISTFIARNSKF